MCALHGCNLCNALQTICLGCDSSLHFHLNGTLCSCDPGYYDDGVNSSCIPCDSVDTNCLTCNYNTGAGGTGCYTCVSGYFSNSGVCVLCGTVSTGCVICSANGQDCLQCD